MNKFIPILAGACATCAVASAASGATPPSPDQAQFAPYAPLIGVWDIAPEQGGSVRAQLEFKWGPNKSYIWYSQSFLMNGKSETHFEGMLGWNGVSRKLDTLAVLDLHYGRAIEEGTFAVQPDGSFVRDIMARYSEGAIPAGGQPVGPEGKTEHFRQTFTNVNGSTMLTTVMHETATGWVPTFPGSDHLKLTRHVNG